MNRSRVQIRSVLVGIISGLLVLQIGAPDARALTLDARALAGSGAVATRATGRVLEARSERGPGGVLVTRVVLGDDGITLYAARPA